MTVRSILVRILDARTKEPLPQAVAHLGKQTYQANPSGEVKLSLSPEELEAMTEEEYLALFAGSAVKRAGLSGLQRTIRSLRDNFQED